ncbi:MAG: hypothetical protein HZB82_00305 [Deltaproteobacteria bacterium]|nr:hypothetical protein [Deltaproteobacteria bacterium]
MKMRHLLVMGLSLLLFGCTSIWNDANQFYKNKDYDKALAVYQDAEKKEPKGLSDPVNALHYRETKKTIADRYYKEALDNAEKGDMNNAIILLKKAGELDPENADVKDALQRLQSRKEDNIKKADTLFAQGSAYVIEKNWRAAVKPLDEAVKFNRNLMAAYAKKLDAVAGQRAGDGLYSDGMAKFNAGKVRGALAVLQECKAKDPFHPKVDEAIKATEARLKSSNKIFAEAEKFRTMRNWSEAAKLYAKTIEMDSEFTEAGVRQEEVTREENTGNQLFEQGNTSLAIKKLNLALNSFQKCKEQSPYHGSVAKAIRETEGQLARAATLRARADAAIKGQRLGETIATLENLLSIYPFDENAAVSLVTTYIAASKLLETNALYANMAIFRKKAKDLATGFTNENSTKSEKLSSFSNEDISPIIDQAISKLNQRTAYELEVIARDKKGSSANEDTLGQSILAGLNNGKPVNLTLKSRSFSKLSEEERARVAAMQNIPNKFAISLEIIDIVPDETRNEVQLTKDYISSYYTEPNPEYDVALNNYQAEQNNYNSAMSTYNANKAEFDRQARQATQGQGMFGAVMAGVMSGVYSATMPSRQKMDDARSRLDNTPRTLKKENHDTHYYNEVTISRKVAVSATGKLAGPDIDSTDDWQEEEAVSGSYFDNPNPKAGIVRVNLQLSPNKELTVTALKKLSKKVQADYFKRLKEHLVDMYIEKGNKETYKNALLGAYENYLNAVAIDPAMAIAKLSGAKDAKAVTIILDAEVIRLVDNKIKREYKDSQGDKPMVLPLDALKQ